MKIVKMFTKHGWKWRTCAWDEYEIESHGVAELVITSTNPILMSGGVAADADAIASIESILNNDSVVFDFELYDQNDKLILPGNSKPPPAGNAV